MKKHEWKETTEDGETRFVRFLNKGGRWTMWAKLKGEDFAVVEPMPVADLRSLREILWAKYQRNRVALRSVEEVDQMIARAEG